jgi:hypothetical protein
MNNGRLEEQLIEQFKEEFHKKTGKWVKVSWALKQHESEANFADHIDFWKLVKTIFDYTGWKRSETFSKKTNGARGRTIGSTDEKAFRRGLIDYIAVNNGCLMSHCARITNRDHTTVGHSLQMFQNRLDTEPYTKKLFTEVVDYVRANYHLYKNRVVGESDIE